MKILIYAAWCVFWFAAFATVRVLLLHSGQTGPTVASVIVGIILMLTAGVFIVKKYGAPIQSRLSSKNISIIVIAVAIIGASLIMWNMTTPVKTYEDCVLQEMHDIHSSQDKNNVMDACRQKFPEK